MKEQLVTEIVQMEWEMFDAVNSIGGRALCQEDQESFLIMRASQAEAWPEELLFSYLSDLWQAKSECRNLMTEKYARMMETTAPDEFAAIASFLPTVDEKTLELIERIVEICLAWRVKASARYPHLLARGRTTYSKDDTFSQTSYETYFRSELMTYSPQTVQLFFEMIVDYQKTGNSLEEITLLNSVRKYGYTSLQQANDQARPKISRQSPGAVGAAADKKTAKQ